MSKAEVRRFEAAIVSGRRGGAGIEIPFSVEEVYGTRGQVKVVATFDGHEYRGSLAPMGGMHFLGVRKDIRAAIGKDVGDTLAVTLARDTAPRVVDVPPDFAAALDAHPEAKKRFEAMSYTHRKEYAAWIVEAKKAETRERRLGKAVEMILAGKSR